MNNRQVLRKQIRAKRNALSKTQQQAFAEKLVSTVAKSGKLAQANRIAIYLTNDGELDTSPLIQWCWQQGIKTALPLVHPFAKGHLLFMDYHQGTQLADNQYGIPEPRLKKDDIVLLQDIDIVFTPLVAFDLSGARLGMGGGYYDRTLATWFEAKKKGTILPYAYPIGIAHNCQQVDKIDSETWDVPLPEIITPSDHHIF